MNVDKTDLELLLAVRNGDHEAFESIYHRYKNDCYSVVTRFIADRDDAKDVLQDFFISLWHKRESIEIKSSLKWFLITSLKYRSISYVRQNLSKTRFIDSLAAFERSDGDVWNQSTPIEVSETAALIQQEIDALPPRTREIFLLSRETSLSIKEIADQLGISNQVIKNKISFALKLLRYRLRELKNLFL